MTSVAVLLLSALVPYLGCQLLQAAFAHRATNDPSARERNLRRFRRVAFFAGSLAILSAGVAGALLADPTITPRWPTFGAWFFSSLCMTAAWVAVALGQRTPDEIEAMPSTQAFGRAVQTATIAVVATGLGTLVLGVVRPALPGSSVSATVLCALLAVAAVAILSPWLMMLTGVWPVFRTRLHVGQSDWRIAHLPVPNPFMTHVAAVPWLHAVLLTDGVLKRMPERYWRTLVAFEVSGSDNARLDRLQRWLIAVPLSTVVFFATVAAAEGEPRKLVAGICLAVAFTFVSTWAANRQTAAGVSMDLGGPTPQDLAQTLRHLPPSHGQALPHTSHKPLGTALYDRLFALGHDPGPRPR
ncbi:MAG: hypothetical protein AAF436_02400 [Myxococcota bacterium]